MAYQIAAIPITLSDVQGHSVSASLFKCDFSYSRATADNISTDIHTYIHSFLYSAYKFNRVTMPHATSRGLCATAQLLVLDDCH